MSSTRVYSKGHSFILSVLVDLLLPALPIATELYSQGFITTDSLMLTAAFYSLTVGLATRDDIFFVISLLGLVLCSIGYGIVVGSGEVIDRYLVTAESTFGIVLAMGIMIRFRRHMLWRKPYELFQAA